jgi:hypothetical protein
VARISPRPFHRSKKVNDKAGVDHRYERARRSIIFHARRAEKDAVPHIYRQSWQPYHEQQTTNPTVDSLQKLAPPLQPLAAWVAPIK